MAEDKNRGIDIKKPILVVDDSYIIHTLMKNMFKEHNIVNYEFASNGVKAVEMVKTKKYSLAIVDLLLPQLDGISVIREIKDIDPKLPVIVLTAILDQRFKDECMKAGAEAYVTKPFNNDDLMQLIYKYYR